MITTDANELVAEITTGCRSFSRRATTPVGWGISAPPLPIRLKPIRGYRHPQREAPWAPAVPMQRDVAGHAARIIRR